MELLYLFRRSGVILLDRWGMVGLSSFFFQGGCRLDRVWLGYILRFYHRDVDLVGEAALRTMGETRLWYSFFLPVAGVITYVRWRYKWILSFSTLLAFVFICVNLFKPEIHNKTLMPALQSPWFAPHVIVYMFSYAMLGAAALIAIYLLIRARKKGIDEGMMSLCDNLVYVGMAFLTIGMLFGALWAKEAWGHYWNWDPKETWAAATWLGYLIYIHYRLRHHLRYSAALGLLVFSFLLLQVCWIGVNYLPSARGYSVHTYNME